MNLLTFCLSSDFASFRDPSITTAQTSYYIPSKSTVIGLLGGMIGIQRGHSLGPLYSKEYLEFFKETKIGLRYIAKPLKISFSTNHRSLKGAKTKPYKVDLIQDPKYQLVISTSSKFENTLHHAIEKNEFVFSPYLGAAYCLAKINDFSVLDGDIIDNVSDKKTSFVMLDESETIYSDFEIKLGDLDDSSSLIIERHLHHYFQDDTFSSAVLKHWIPTERSEFEIDYISVQKISSFVYVSSLEQVVCLY